MKAAVLLVDVQQAWLDDAMPEFPHFKEKVKRLITFTPTTMQNCVHCVGVMDIHL